MFGLEILFWGLARSKVPFPIELEDHEDRLELGEDPLHNATPSSIASTIAWTEARGLRRS